MDGSSSSNDAQLRARLRRHPQTTQRSMADVRLTRRNYATASVTRRPHSVHPKPLYPVATQPTTGEPPSRPIQVLSERQFPAGPSVRHAINPSPVPKSNIRKKHTSRRLRDGSRRRLTPLSWAMIIFAVILFTAGIWVSIDSWRTNRSAEATVKKLQSSSNTNNSPATDDNPPKTDQPSSNDLASYQVAPTKPRIVSIPKIGVKARIVPEGVTKDGSLAAPGNVYDTGWYTASSLPGTQGAMLLDGHVSSWTTNGVFYNLKKLQAGDIVTVERGDTKTYQYKVVKMQTYSADAVDMNAAVTPVVPGTPGLNLITCGGKVKPGTSEFTERVVVFTQQIT